MIKQSIKYFIFCVALCFSVMSVHAEENKQKYFTVVDKSVPDNTVNRSKFAVSLFKQACFFTHLEPDNVRHFANQFMTPVPYDDSFNALYRNSVSAKKGDVWYTNVVAGVQPLNHNEKVFGGRAGIVYEEEYYRCSIVSHGTDEKTLHDELKNFSEEAKEKMKDSGIKITYTYNDAKQTGNHNLSRINFVWPNGNKMLLYATTVQPKDLNEIASMITLSPIK